MDRYSEARVKVMYPELATWGSYNLIWIIFPLYGGKDVEKRCCREDMAKTDQWIILFKVAACNAHMTPSVISSPLYIRKRIAPGMFPRNLKLVLSSIAHLLYHLLADRQMNTLLLYHTKSQYLE